MYVRACLPSLPPSFSISLFLSLSFSLFPSPPSQQLYKQFKRLQQLIFLSVWLLIQCLRSDKNVFSQYVIGRYWTIFSQLEDNYEQTMLNISKHTQMAIHCRTTLYLMVRQITKSNLTEPSGCLSGLSVCTQDSNCLQFEGVSGCYLCHHC